MTPELFNGVLCGSDYKLTVTCDPNACFPPCTVPCESGDTAEVELCGQDLNGGCVDPNTVQQHLQTIQPNQWICGTAWASNGVRDIDMYRITFTNLSTMNFELNAEFPPVIGWYDGPAGGVPACADGYTYHPNLEACTFYGLSVGLGPGTLPGAEHWIIFYNKVTTFAGYPCGYLNNYRFRAVVAEVNCAADINCADTGTWGSPENEPCDPNDNTNGGCNEPNVPFKSLPLDPSGNTAPFAYCCTSGTFQTVSPSQKDYDWFSVTVPSGDNQQWQILCQAEFPVLMDIIRLGITPDPNSSACDFSVLETTSWTACATNPTYTTTTCFPPGTYYLRFQPDFDPNVPLDCTWNYAFTVSAATCTPCVVTPVGTPENEACEGLVNNGCYNPTDPNNPSASMSPISCGQTIAGKTSASSGDSGGYNDDDYYRLTLTAANTASVSATVNTEVPMVLKFYRPAAAGGKPTCATTESGAFVFAPCTPATVTLGTNLPNGEYWIYMNPGTGATTPIFAGYPCGMGIDAYNLTVTCN